MGPKQTKPIGDLRPNRPSRLNSCRPSVFHLVPPTSFPPRYVLSCVLCFYRAGHFTIPSFHCEPAPHSTPSASPAPRPPLPQLPCTTASHQLQYQLVFNDGLCSQGTGTVLNTTHPASPCVTGNSRHCLIPVSKSQKSALIFFSNILIYM